MIGKKYTYEQVKEIFDRENCKLLENNYLNNKQKLKYQCQCGNISSTILSRFIKHSNHKCPKCGKKIKYTYEEVKNIFEQGGCKLLSTKYENCYKQKLNYICTCGKESKISLRMFQRGSRCRECGYKKVGDKKRYSYEEVKKFFEDNGCTLLEEKYLSSQQKLNYICVCGRKSKIQLNNFLYGQRCIKCGIKKRAASHKTPLEVVKKEFEKNGCQFLDAEYKGCEFKHNYLCSCGRKSKISFIKFKAGQRCKQCGLEKLANHFKISYEKVKKYFEEKGCELLSTEYKNFHSNILYKCKCGTISKTTFSRFSRQSPNCKKCGSQKGAEKQKLSYNHIKKEFEDRKCELLSPPEDYKNYNSKLLYKCKCGTIAKISWGSFHNGSFCRKCGLEKQKRFGRDHCCWNPNLTNEDRLRDRSLPENKQWRKDVYTRDNYICQYCNKNSRKLRAHHIESYAKNKELRTIVSNGITFCEKHHKQFHKWYGQDSTREKVEKFMLSKQKEYELVDNK